VALLGAKSEGVRLRAADSDLHHAHKAVELLDYEGRLTFLETQSKQVSSSDGGIKLLH